MIRKTGWLSNAKQTTSFYSYSLECEESSPLTFNAAAPSCCVSVSSCLLMRVSKVMLFRWFLSVSTSLVLPPPPHTHTLSPNAFPSQLFSGIFNTRLAFPCAVSSIMKRTVARRVFSEVSKLSHEAKMVPTCAGFETSKYF